MSGKFEGIGARLQKKPEGAKIVEIISGGPVWRDRKLEVGDEILKVGQDGEVPVNIVGMRLDDAIKLIKGPKGTTVHVGLKGKDNVPKKGYTNVAGADLVDKFRSGLPKVDIDG